MMRVRVNFDKTEEMRFTGHLDLYRTWERTLRRAGLPLAYSQGFKPHPRLQIAAALPLGFTSSNDLMDIWLEEKLPISFIQSCILAALPPGLQLNSLTEVPLNQPALQSLLTASEYQITFLESILDLEQRVQALTKHSSILIERRGKNYDLRPLLLSIEILIHNADEQQRLKTLLRTDSALHARPDELVNAMGIPAEKALFHRLKLHFNQELT
jgi:radical SAM-linked protein